ncbi:tail assembly chaperone [Microbacterium phage Sinatra]|uniref:Tail assembly chaperone n=2 Tax=Kojivirus koji TaxID=2560594 RepID=A0A4D6E314_9CAUD|nr:tail assembly chaperone [Microbacterium phage PrincePhergus]QBZ73066.1 tail assembly chaperone [Microbacterium phage Pherbot]QCG77921.1 tail assembly chaperone [Microbacterium phage Bustleton]QDH92743.1 tail assembly chaperone [Microbacterium phage Sinatra]
MSFNSYEELMQAVEERRSDILTLEVDLGATYSQEHEDAKKELQQAKALKQLAGGQDFLADNLAALEARVAETKPESRNVWVRFSRLKLGEWAMLVKTSGLTPIDQYEKVLPKTFIGVYGQDPAGGEDGEVIEPLSTDPALLSSKGDRGILPGGMLHQVVQAFMAWQNSSGDITIRPTKSGLV